MPDIALALLAALAAAALYTTSVTLQALEARRAPVALQLRPALIGFLVRRPRWMLGTALGLLGWPFQALALARGPLALVQPTLALSVVGLLVAGHLILGEPIRPRSVCAAGAIVGGVSLLALKIPAAGAAGSMRGTVVLLAALGAVALSPFIPRNAWAASARFLALATGSAYVLLALATTFLDSALGRGVWWPAAAWMAVCGASAGAAGLTEMSALRLAPATVVVPIIFALETVAPALLGPVVGQPLGTDAVSLTINLAGLALVGVGVTLLARSRSVSDLVAAGA